MYKWIFFLNILKIKNQVIRVNYLIYLIYLKKVNLYSFVIKTKNRTTFVFTLIIDVSIYYLNYLLLLTI